MRASLLYLKMTLIFFNEANDFNNIINLMKYKFRFYNLLDISMTNMLNFFVIKKKNSPHLRNYDASLLSPNLSHPFFLKKKIFLFF